MSYFKDLKTFSFTLSDIDLITFSLKRLAETAGSKSVAEEARQLRDYTLRERDNKIKEPQK